MTETDKKRCSRCGETGLSDRFPPNPRTQNGLSSWCRRCHAAALRRWRDKNPEKAASYNLARRVKHELRPCTECGELSTPKPRLRCGACRGHGLANTPLLFECISARLTAKLADARRSAVPLSVGVGRRDGRVRLRSARAMPTRATRVLASTPTVRLLCIARHDYSQRIIRG